MKEHLESGGLVVYPTSTLPGLGCLPITNGLDNLYSTKNRPETMPVSLGVSSMEQAEAIVEIPIFSMSSYPLLQREVSLQSYQRSKQWTLD